MTARDELFGALDYGDGRLESQTEANRLLDQFEAQVRRQVWATVASAYPPTAGSGIAGAIIDLIDPDRPSVFAAHRYLSTACTHGDHAYCQSNTGAAGTKIPSVCKFCRAVCECPVCEHEPLADEACECGHYRTSHRGSSRFGSTCDMCAVLRMGDPYHPFTPLRTPATQVSAVASPATGSEEQPCPCCASGDHNDLCTCGGTGCCCPGRHAEVQL